MAKIAMVVKQQKLEDQTEKKYKKFKTRAYNRCKVCGRPRSYLRLFNMCRICFRKHANEGNIPGVVKSSW